MPPLMVNETSAYGTVNYPIRMGKCIMQRKIIFISSHCRSSRTNIYRDTISKENELPIKMTAYTPCFRREAVVMEKMCVVSIVCHQFDKVEIVQLVNPY
jgi:seryl-tRNA synthetase